MASRFRGRVAAAVCAVLVACGGSARFPADAANEFLDVCMAEEFEERTCRCILEYLEGRFTLAQLNRLTADIEIGEGLPKDIVDDAVDDCR